MDVMMPVMDGLEATRQIRRIPQLAQLPVIAVSASAFPEDAARCRAAGATEFIAKPIEHETLLRALGEHLRLDWIYGELAHKPEVLSAGAADDLHIPSPEEMHVLHQLALAGDMRGIRKRADHIRTLSPRYGALADRLTKLAQRYESKAILALIERYRVHPDGRARDTRSLAP
jgi:CheY-like chemotaxis protein